jgi:hypothetical protein
VFSHRSSSFPLLLGSWLKVASKSIRSFCSARINPNMQIDTTKLMDNSLDLGPKPLAGPRFCGFNCCVPQSQQKRSNTNTKHTKIPDTTRTTPSTPTDDDDDDEIPQFFIDAEGIPEDETEKNDAFWKKLMSILWLLLAAQYWTGARAGKAEDGEKSLPPEINLDGDDDELSLETKED